MTFKIADLKQDYKILLQAKKDSFEYLNDASRDNENIKIELIILNFFVLWYPARDLNPYFWLEGPVSLTY